jgi:hypothetical protein
LIRISQKAREVSKIACFILSSHVVAPQHIRKSGNRKQDGIGRKATTRPSRKTGVRNRRTNASISPHFDRPDRHFTLP